MRTAAGTFAFNPSDCFTGTTMNTGGERPGEARAPLTPSNGRFPERLRSIP